MLQRSRNQNEKQFRVDEEDDGFADEECETQPNEENDMNIDGETEVGGDDFSSIFKIVN